MAQPASLESLTSAKRSATFEQPYEMLEACHERLHRVLALLQRLREHLPQHGADTQAQQAARDVMRYFDQAAPQHHTDEELHVFPPLLTQGVPQTVDVVHRLQADHVQMESLWPAARRVLDAISQGALAQLTPGDDAALDAFASLHADHIAAEEQLVYPAARAIASDEAISAMGQEMMQRRGAR
jgi:hemerythrin-like domain-containing protein